MAGKVNASKSTKSSSANEQKISTTKGPTSVRSTPPVSAPPRTSSVRSTVTTIKVSPGSVRSSVMRVNKSAMHGYSTAQVASIRSTGRTPAPLPPHTVKPATNPRVVMRAMSPMVMKSSVAKQILLDGGRLRGAELEHKVYGQLIKNRSSLIGSQVNALAGGRRVRIDNVISTRGGGAGKLRPIETKNTRWHKVQNATLKRYVNQAARNKGAIITTSKDNLNDWKGKTITGRPILVIPKEHASHESSQRLEAIKDYAHRKGVHIQLR